MSDRALVVFHSADGNHVTPTVYLHWLGSEVPSLIAETKAIMANRSDDPDYAAARFCAVACRGGGNTGVGLMQSPDDIMTNAAKHSHGDAGVILVNAGDFSWKAFGGYLKNSEAA